MKQVVLCITAFICKDKWTLCFEDTTCLGVMLSKPKEQRTHHYKDHLPRHETLGKDYSDPSFPLHKTRKRTSLPSKSSPQGQTNGSPSGPCPPHSLGPLPRGLGRLRSPGTSWPLPPAVAALPSFGTPWTPTGFPAPPLQGPAPLPGQRREPSASSPAEGARFFPPGRAARSLSGPQRAGLRRQRPRQMTAEVPYGSGVHGAVHRVLTLEPEKKSRRFPQGTLNLITT